MNKTGPFMNLTSLSNRTTRPSTTLSPEWLEYEGVDSVLNQIVPVFRLITALTSGLIGSILLSGTIVRNRALSDPCYYCYQGMSVAAGFRTLFIILELLSQISVHFEIDWLIKIISKGFFRPVLVSSTMGALSIVETMAGILFQIQTYLIVYLSFHRAMACLAPRIFKRINTTRVSLSVNFAVYVLFFGVYIPRMIFTDQSARSFFNVFASVVGIANMVLITLTSVLAIVGFLRVYHYKRAMVTKFRSRTLTDSEKARMKESKKNLKLCYLQMSQALPIVIHYTIQFLDERVFHQCTCVLSGAYTQLILTQLRRLFDSLSSDLHFLDFWVFSVKFRTECRKRFACKRTTN